MGIVHVLKTPSAIDNEETVALLRKWLAYAEAGEIVSVGIVAMRPDGSIDHQAHIGPSLAAIITGLEILKWRLIQTRGVPSDG